MAVSAATGESPDRVPCLRESVCQARGNSSPPSGHPYRKWIQNQSARRATLIRAAVCITSARLPPQGYSINS